MKILYFLAHPYSLGGAAKQLIAHARIMKLRGHDVVVIVQTDNNGIYAKEYDEICDIYCLQHESIQYSISTCIEEIDILSSYNDIEVIEKTVQRFNPDIIHSVQLNVGTELVSRKLGIPHLFSIYPMTTEMFNIAWKDVFASYLCGDSLFFSEQWKKGLGIHSKCIRVAYNPTIEKEKKLKNISPKSEYELINIGLICNYKRQKEILKFILQCKKIGFDVHIRFLGYDTGAYAEECRKYVKDNGLEEQVDFEGFVSDVEDYLISTDLMVHASTVESYPGVIVEAMAKRVPVLATPVAGVPELLKDGVNGFLTQGYTANSIYEKFLSYIDLKKAGSICEIKDNAYQTYLNYHTYDVVGTQLEGYYRRIIDEYDNKPYQEMVFIIDCIREFYQKNNLNMYSEYTRKRCWYLYHLKEVCKDYVSTMIWGTGEYSTVGVEWSDILCLHVEGFIDSKKRGVHQGYCVYSPLDDAVKRVDCIIVSVVNPDYVCEIMTILEKHGRTRNVSYFLVHNDPCFSANI